MKVDTPAKINLWLEVIHKRPDGYHDLSSLMLPIGIYDHLEITPASELSISCDHPHAPGDARNLAWKAAASFFEAAGMRGGVRIDLRKNIPVGAGLGGGSSDAAAVLLALDRTYPGRLSSERLTALAASLGADVPFFLRRRPALATGIGESLEVVEGLPNYPLVLIKPPLMVSTGWVYQSLKLTRGKSRITLSRLMTCPWRLCDVMENDLESVTLREYPVLVEIKEWLLGQGALGSLMSGSGPTVFSIFEDGSHAERVGVKAREVWKDSWVAVTQVVGGL